MSKEGKWTLAAVGFFGILTYGAVMLRTQPQIVKVPYEVVVTPTASPSASLSVTPKFFQKTVTVAPAKSATVPAVKK